MVPYLELKEILLSEADAKLKTLFVWLLNGLKVFLDKIIRRQLCSTDGVAVCIVICLLKSS